MNYSKFNYLLKTIVLLFVLFTMFLIAPNSLVGGIENSHHDFSNRSWSNGEICRPVMFLMGNYGCS